MKPLLVAGGFLLRLRLRNVSTREKVIFYLSNEGLSILENSAVIGIPIPEKLKDMLIQLTNEKHIPEKDDEKGE